MAPLLENIPLNQLEGKRIGYYPGSFDPFHKGHQAVVEHAKHHVDYVLLYPVPGGDIYKNRSDLATRLQMVQAIYKLDPRVILTLLTPAQMQARLEPIKARLEFVGILGSDAVNTHSNSDDEFRQKMSSIYMRGIPIPEKHAGTTIGALMAFKATSFIINLRQNDDLSKLNGCFDDRPIKSLWRFGPPISLISSTQVRKNLQEEKPISDLVLPEVEALIRKKGLYIDRPTLAQLQERDLADIRPK